MIRFSDDTFVTFFTTAAATKFLSARVSLSVLRDLILKTSADAKPKLPWLKLARFGDKRSDKGSLRHSGNLLAISGIEADCDSERLSFDAATAVLEKAGIRALIYTSPSHTKAKPRWRILAPTSKELPPQRRAKLVARLNGLFGGVLAPESFALSQAYYYGRVDRNPAHRAKIVAGEFIDRRRDLDAGAMGKSERSAATISERAASNQPINPDLIVAALEVIPSDAYWLWLKIGAALSFEFGDAGFELFDRWSARSSKYKANECARKWRECKKFSKITGRTILFYADEAAPGWRQAYEITRWQNFLQSYTKRR